MSISIKTESGIIKVANVGGGGKGNADAVILSKEEYDALPDTKLTDNKQYFVKDWSQSGGSGDCSYEISFEEFKTNKTYFGKDVYVKAYPFKSAISQSGTNLSTTNIPNLMEMENIISCCYVKQSLKASFNLAGYLTDSTHYNVRTVFGVSAGDGILVFEYTKL